MKYRKLIKQLNNLQLFRIFMERRNKTVRIKTKKKAFVSVLLSFVMIMGLFFVPKVNAEEQPDQPNTISFKQVEKDMDMVDGIILRVDGIDQETPISYPAGLITENLSSLNEYLNGTQKFQKAVVKDSITNTETPISRIGTYEETTYYSLNDQQDIGIALTENQTIVLICASQYKVTYDYESSMGSVTGSTELFKGEDLNIAVKANEYYHIESITWNVKSINFSDDKNASIKISGSEINEDVVVKVNFQKDSSYQIIEKGAIIQNGEYVIADGGEGGIQHGDLCLDNDNAIIQDVEPGGSKTFWLYSQSNSGGDEWILNMLKVNGENLNIPLNDEIDTSAVTDLSNGSKVTITLIKKNHQINWKGDDSFWPTSDKYRTIYEVTVSDIKENLVFEGNFKESSNREMILTGLEGIEKVGAASEKYDWETHWQATGYHYYYGLQNNDGDTVYTAYYNNTSGALAKAFNIYLYSVKAGYNPYTVDIEVLYDGTIQNLNDVVDTGIQNKTEWVTVDEIRDGIVNYNSDYRHFEYDEYNWLTDVKNNGYTHGICLKQNTALNQLMRLKAHPYEDSLVFDLNGGEATLGNDYTEENGLYTYNKIYTLANGSVDAYMPDVKPTKTGNVFVGWQLYKDGKAVSDKIYGLNEAFTIDENSIKNAAGDIISDSGHTFTFVAQWENVAESDQTAGIYLEIYKEVESTTGIEKDGKYYEAVGNKTLIDYGTVNSSTFFLNLSSKNPNVDIYTPNLTQSIRYISTIIDEEDSNYTQDSNTFKLYYDFKDYGLTVKKDAIGEYADLSREWNIQVTLKDSNGNPISNKTIGTDIKTDENGKVTLSLKDNEQYIFKDLNINTRYSIEEIEVPEDYTVTYKINDEDKDAVSDQSLSADTTVTVINTMKDEDIDIPDTNIPTSGVDSTISMLSIGTIGLIGVVALLWYWRKKHV